MDDKNYKITISFSSGRISTLECTPEQKERIKEKFSIAFKKKSALYIDIPMVDMEMFYDFSKIDYIEIKLMK